MNATTRMVLAVVCIGVIVLCGALLFGHLVRRSRLADLTEQDLYSLSDGTGRILDDLNQQITLKLYYSREAARGGPENIRFWNNYFLYVRDLLSEYVSRSDGKLSLEVIDPRPFSDEEDHAIADGVNRFNLPGGEGFFFGLVAANEFGKKRVIGLFEPDRQEFVEYDVSKVLSELSRRDKDVVGILSSLPVNGEQMSPYMMQMLMAQGKRPPRPWAIIQQIGQSYEVKTAEIVDGALDETIDFLVVIHPKDLDSPTLFAIDQFVMGGGRLLVFTDPHCREDRPAQASPYAPAGTSSQLNGLLAEWGVTMQPAGIAADRALALQVQARRNAPPQPFLPFLGIDERCVNTDEVISADLHSLTMLFAGVLQPTEGARTQVRPLLTTTETGAVWAPMNPYELRTPDPGRIARAVPDGTDPVMLACLIEGTFASNFPEGIDLPDDEDEKPDKADKDDEPAATQPTSKPVRHLDAVAESAEGAAVVVVADVDMITDGVAYRDTFFGLAQKGDNASLVLNALDFLAGDVDLISVRTRGRYSRPFEVVDEIEREAERATAEQVEKLEANINEMTAKLQKLGAGGSDETDARLLNNKILAQRREIESEIRTARKQLRTLQAERREKVEALQFRLKAWNLTAAPAIILIVAIFLAVYRRHRARRYASRRAGQ